MDRPSLRRLFSACDVNKTGKIELGDFAVVCRELNVPEAEIKSLFDRFDADEDGYIDYSKFSSRFREVSEALDGACGGAGSSLSPGGSWEEFVGRMDSENLLSESLREQLADLYQAIHSCANTALLQEYEKTVHALINQSLDNRQECELLEASLKRTRAEIHNCSTSKVKSVRYNCDWTSRAEEMNSSQLEEVEEDIQLQLVRTEERVREEERKKMEGVMATMQRKYKNEVADLHATVDGLLKRQEDSDLNQTKDEVVKLNMEISNLSQVNEQLRTSLLQAQTNISVLHSELDKLKNMYADQKNQYDREKEDLKMMVMEYQSYSSQIQILQEMNKNLYDSNDGLRSSLASEVVAAKRRLSPQNEIPSRKMKPLQQSTLKHSSSQPDPSKAIFSHVASWADKYLDSGVSLPMDTAESSDYDSDESRGSVETVHHSYSCVPSDVEISEVKSEAAMSVTPSRASSIASSLRRRLSAFSTKPLEASIEETEEPTPMYRLVLAGDAGAGKSSFMLRLTLNEFRGDIQTTLGVDFQIKRMLVDGEKTSLQIWDTAGQERFRSIARSYFRKAHGVLLLYDVTSESSFLNIRAWVDEIQDLTEEKIPMCVIGNKVDLREQLPEGRCVSSLHGEKLAKAYGALFCETSAKEGTNVVEAVLHLAREVKKNVNLRRESGSQVKLSQSNPKKTLNDCCGL